jgi:hypothetical protein
MYRTCICTFPDSAHRHALYVYWTHSLNRLIGQIWVLNVGTLEWAFFPLVHAFHMG